MWNPEICQDPPTWGQDDQTLFLEKVWVFLDSGFVKTCDELVIGHTTKKEKHFVHQELKKKQELILVVKNWNVAYVQKYSKERKA